MAKVSIFGAGNVGSMLASRIIDAGLASVALVDNAAGLAMVKAMDIEDAVAIAGGKASIEASETPEAIKSSSIVVITAGLTRKAGMSREELLKTNAAIVKEIAKSVKKYAPEALLLVITNPLDLMSYVAYRESGFNHKRVFGMAGLLDAGRFSGLIARQLGISAGSIEAKVIGEHGNEMLVLSRLSKIEGDPLERKMTKEKLAKIISDTKTRGTNIVALLKDKSAYFGPSQAAFYMIRAILNDEKKVFCASCYLNGEYGVGDLYLGVPARFGRQGVEEIISLKLQDDEKALMQETAKKIKSYFKLLGY